MYAGCMTPKRSDEQPHSTQPPALAKLHIWQFQAVRDVLFLAAIVGLFWLGYALRAVTVPLLVALLLAYLFEPVVSRMVQKTRYSRPVVVGALMSSVGLVVAIVVLIVTMAVVGQTTRLVQDIRDGRFQDRAAAVWNWVPEEFRDTYEEWRRSILGDDENGDLVDVIDEVIDGDDQEETETEPQFTSNEIQETGHGETMPAGFDARDEQWLRELIREETRLIAAQESEPTTWMQDWMRLALGGADAVWRIVLSLIGIGFLAFLIPFYFFFFSVAYPRITEFGKGLIPESNRDRTLELLGKMDRVIAGFVRGRIIVSLLMGVMFAIGWWIVGVPYAILLGFIIGLFCAVPFLGIIGVPIAVGLLLFNQLDPDGGLNMPLWAILLWPTLVFVIVQSIESYAITPLIAGKATNLDPVTIIVAVIAGGSIMGIYGMLLAIPVAACLKILITDVLLPKVRAWTRGEAADPLPID
jgi:predicted PurR-regulated permease PerM